MPNTGLNECEPKPNSGTFVLPMNTQPAARSRLTINESAAGTNVANSGEPDVVGIPATSVRSLIACGSPCIQPRDRPAASSSSHSAASAISTSGSRRLMIALTAALRSSMRSRWACITSRHDTSRRWIASDSAAAPTAVISMARAR